MLNRINVRGYKSFVELNLSLKPLSVLIGPNSAGKSNFLDALQLLSRMATKPTLKEAFERPYRGTPLESFTFIGEGVEGILSHETRSFRFEVDVTLSDTVIEHVNNQIREMRTSKPPDIADSRAAKPKSTYITRKNLRYALEVEVTPKSGMLRVVDPHRARYFPLGLPTLGARDRVVRRVNSVSHFTRSNKPSNRTSPCSKRSIRGIKLHELSRKSHATGYFNWRNSMSRENRSKAS